MNKFLTAIFSVTNDKNHKVINILGLKFKFRLKGFNYDNKSPLGKIQIDDLTFIRYVVHDFENIANTLIKNDDCLFIDIGANFGSSAKLAYHYFPNVQVISYEPLKSCFAELEKIKKNHNNFIAKNVALGENEGTVKINEVGEQMSGLSSILKINENYKYFGKKYDVINSYDVECSTIQKEIPFWETFKQKIKLLKIDTQGTELSILKNGKDYLSSGNINIIYMELLIANKYEGQGYYLDTFNFLIGECGFVIYNINPEYRELDGDFVSPSTFGYGWTTEYDMILVHKSFLSSIVKNGI